MKLDADENRSIPRRSRSQSTPRKGGEDIISTEEDVLKADETRKKVVVEEGGNDSNDLESKNKSLNDEAASSNDEISPSLPHQLSSDTLKMLHLPNVQSMTVKALKAELNLYKVDYSSFCEKEQLITAVRHSRETCQRPQPIITSMKLKALRAELTMYDVDYSNFREKSEFVEALRNARETESESVPQHTMDPPPEETVPEASLPQRTMDPPPKEVVEEPYSNLKGDHREPITHPRYKLGDSARDGDMIVFTKKSHSRSGRRRRRSGQDNSEASSGDEDEDKFTQSKVIASMKELRHLDAAFIRRSDGRWTYAIVADGNEEGIRFVVNKKGATKTLTQEMWNKNVRRIKVLTQRKGDVLKVNDKKPRGRRDMSKSRSKRRGRIVSPSPTRHYRYRKLDALNVPPTITEGKVFTGRGRETGLQLQPQKQMSQVGATFVLPEWAHLWEDLKAGV